MHKTVSLVLFSILEVLAILSCLVLVMTTLTPILFIVECYGDNEDNYHYFGPLFLYHNKSTSRYDGTTNLFKFIQATFIISFLLAVSSTMLAVLAYKTKKLKPISGCFLAATASALFMFAVSYTAQYNMAKSGKTFIFKPGYYLATIEDHEKLQHSNLVGVFWSMTVVFFLFACLFFLQNFISRRTIQITVQEEQMQAIAY
ncbi:hypothetical protein RF11_05954 [Thelohanellus kitauei]|uniref:Uncharacterized protein n=1 Tax=Thelohanellus kitauei TaxID=669202 RepID=A0A0C2J746_THEKT|nr:hypothetical protein RF11_05954 [Thelohanellus kitauei]